MNSTKALWVALAAAFLVIAYQQVQIGGLKKIGGRAEASSDAARGDRELAARLDELEARVQRLGRAAIAEQSARGESATLSSEDLEALKEDVSAAAATALQSGEGRERLRAAIREEQSAMEEERRQERSSRMKQARDERLAKFIDDARLSDAQARSVTEAHAAEWEKMQALFEDVRGGTRSWQDVRPEMRAMREQTDEVVKQTLDSQQYAAWETMRSESRQDR